MQPSVPLEFRENVAAKQQKDAPLHDGETVTIVEFAARDGEVDQPLGVGRISAGPLLRKTYRVAGSTWPQPALRRGAEGAARSAGKGVGSRPGRAFCGGAAASRDGTGGPVINQALIVLVVALNDGRLFSGWAG